MLRFLSIRRAQIFRSQYCGVSSGLASTPKAEECLESRHGFPPAVVPENKLVKVGFANDVGLPHGGSLPAIAGDCQSRDRPAERRTSHPCGVRLLEVEYEAHA